MMSRPCRIISRHLSSFTNHTRSSLQSTHRSLNPSINPSINQSIRHLRVIKSVEEMRSIRAEMSSDSTLGFVPTMGALHPGHLELVSASRENNSHTVVSIFVNPTQFLPGEDFSKYPRQLNEDLEMLKKKKVDFAFCPSVDNMYPGPPYPVHGTFVDIEGIDETYEGRMRPGHFKGVATVCTKLFNIIQPNRAYFGQKDGMQCIVLQRVVRELDIPIDIEIVPTSRDEDGLARSSRNVYLSAEDRALAPVLYAGLQAGEALYKSGERDSNKIRDAVKHYIEKNGKGKFEIQYVSVCDTLTGLEIKGAVGEANLHASVQRGVNPNEPQQNQCRSTHMLSLAAKIGKTRLIDNVILPAQVKEATEYE